MKRTTSILFFLASVLAGAAQEVWTVEQCMRYAVEHNHSVARQRLALDNSRAECLKAVGNLLPSVDGGMGAQYNFGRAIDPETNTYTDVSTFYNSNYVQASLPVFDGLRRYHQLQAARVGVLQGKTQLQIRQDEVALDVMQAYADALYYQQTSQMARAKLEESQALLHKTRVMMEVGQKSEADVVQVAAQVAADECEVTRQENLYASAMLELMGKMGDPSPALSHEGGGIMVTTQGFVKLKEVSGDGENATVDCDQESPSLFAGRDGEGSALLLEAQRQNVAQARQQLSMARGQFFPSISLSAGVSTTYYRTVGKDAVSFSRQWRDNAGQYVGLSFSVPLFNGFSAVTNLRRQRNNLAMAQEEMLEKEDELLRLRSQVEADCVGYAREAAQMERKVEADSLALRLTTRQFEEGMASALDVQATAAVLLQSRASLLRSQLMLALKQRLAKYYNA